MALMINTNLYSLGAARNLTKAQGGLEVSMARLSSGLRINSAKDDAAGMAIASRMTSQIRGIDQAARNANDGISAAQTAEGALRQSSDLLQRIRELAVQSSNDTNSASDRQSLQSEVAQLQAEIDTTANNTAFNGKKLLDGSFTAQNFQVGANAHQSISLSIGSAKGTDIGNYGFGMDGDALDVQTDTSALADNGITAQTFTITGQLGSADVEIEAAGWSAGQIAGAVNAASASTGVSASALTQATITGMGAGDVSFDLKGKNTTGITISATVVSSGDLSGLASAINSASSRTGITATANGGTLKLESLAGDDIQIDNFDTNSSDTDFDIDGLGANGGTVDAAGDTSARVTGKVTFASSGAYSLTPADPTDTTFIQGASTGTLSSVAAIDISSQQGAVDALAVIDGALSALNSQRGALGAVQNRFENTISNLNTTGENLKAARGRIEDADFAAETANLTRSQVLQQAGMAMLAQGNQAPQSVLSLLRG